MKNIFIILLILSCSNCFGQSYIIPNPNPDTVVPAKILIANAIAKKLDTTAANLAIASMQADISTRATKIGLDSTKAFLPAKLDTAVANIKFRNIDASLITKIDSAKVFALLGGIGPYVPYTAIVGMLRLPDTVGILETQYKHSIDINLIRVRYDSVFASIHKPTFLSNINVTQTAAIALTAGMRELTFTCNGLISGEPVLVTATTGLAGYAIMGAVVISANTIVVKVSAPALALGASFTMPCTVTVFR